MLLLSVENRLILSCIKLCPNQDELEQINGLISQVQDWDYFIHTIIDRGIGPLLYKKLPFLTNSSIIPETVKTSLQQIYFKTFSRSTILYEHFQKVAKAFTSHNIPVIALKGIYLSEWLYQDIGMRQFSDIDLLVKEENAESCLYILEELGYKKNSVGQLSEIVLSQFQKDIVHYSPMISNGVSIELHIKLHSKHEKYNLNGLELWKNAISSTINGVIVQALNATDLLIYLCLHLDKHFKVGPVQFTCFNDITNLLENLSGSLNWNEFTEACRLYNCEEVVYKYLVMVNTYMNAAVPADIIQKYSTLLTEKDEQLFIKYLKGDVGAEITLSSHFKYLKNVSSLSDRVRYVWGVLFPSRAFMVQKYGLQTKEPRTKNPDRGKNPEVETRNMKLKFWWLWYPYRWWIGVRGVVNHLKKFIVHS